MEGKDSRRTLLGRAKKLRDTASAALERNAEHQAAHRESIRAAVADSTFVDKKERKNQRRAQHAKTLRVACIYLGSTTPHPQLTPGRKYTLQLDGDGIQVAGFKAAVPIPWSEVVDLEVIDISRTEIKTRVEQRASGGVWALPGTMAPVGRTSSKHVARSKLALETAAGDWLLEVHVDPSQLEGKVLLARGRSRPDGGDAG